jgi:hypothetical protein
MNKEARGSVSSSKEGSCYSQRSQVCYLFFIFFCLVSLIIVVMLIYSFFFTIISDAFLLLEQ